MKKILFFVFVIVSVFVINNLVRSIITLWQKQDLVVNLQNELEAKKRENQVLKQKLSQAESPEFVENQAREKLFLAKQGESEVLLPRELIEVAKEEKPKPVIKENWQKWIDLFF